MHKIVIRPAWQFRSSSGETIDARVFTLLRAIHETGKLTEAAKRVSLSYRHAWDLLARWDEFFGSPLVTMARGKGAYLSPLGEKLVWAAQRTDASLFPHLDNIASELNIEINRHLRASRRVLRLHASHGYAVEKIPELLRESTECEVDLQYMGSVDALRSLANGACDLAGFHVPVGNLATTLWPHYEPWLRPREQRIVRLVTRTQGLIVARGNPLGIRELKDLARPGVRFVNRQRGSGTRILLDGMLAAEKVRAAGIQGYTDTGEFTHAAVAAFVASHMADAAFGVEPAARQFRLDFIPLASERYMLACDAKTLQSGSMRELVVLLGSEAFREALKSASGYQPDGPGEVQTIAEAFPWTAKRRR